MKLWTLSAGMLLRADCRLILLAEKNLTTASNKTGKQAHWVILLVQLSKKAGLTNEEAWGRFNETFTRVIYKCSHCFKVWEQ